MLWTLFVLPFTFATENYFGANSQEATLKFKAKADIAFEEGISTTNPAPAKLEKVEEAIHFQIDHLIGHFQSESFANGFGHKGVMGEYYNVKVTNIEKLGDGRLLVDYDFSGKVVFEAKTFKNRDLIKVPLKLPLATDKIYQMGMVHGKNKCTDDHYNEESDFWYFWDTELPGCPLFGNTEDVLYLTGELKALENTDRTYPEYDMLYGANGNGDNLEISIFLGYIDEVNYRSVNTQDDGYLSMKALEEWLEKEDFVLADSKDRFSIKNDKEVRGIAFYRVFQKDVKNHLGETMTATVNVLLANTELPENENTFAYYYALALQDSDIVVYDGHSGLGGNLDFDNLAYDVDMKKTKYQIFYFNGCSSYPYYNGKYFDKKGGSKYLDILTSGLPTFAVTGFGNISSFVDPFIKGKTISYQTMLRAIEKTNEDYGTYLLGVNGDEDNKFTPAQ